MRVLVVSDMEGVSGIVKPKQTLGGAALYDEGRKLYTEEINAAVRGARAAGATEIDARGKFVTPGIIDAHSHIAADAINEGGTVTLEIVQETSSVAGQIIDDSTDLITNKREISTTALVDDGDILVIGGLIDDMSESFSTKVPLLGDIPIAGNLFRTNARSRDRRNLVVFIRPTILRDRETAAAATRKKLDYLRARDILDRGEPVSDLERLIDEVTGLSTLVVIDAKRRLVLIRRDNVEHLVMTGGPVDIVIESGIGAAQSATESKTTTSTRSQPPHPLGLAAE